MIKRKVTPILQMSQTECGLCAATMLMEFYGVKLKIHNITTKFKVGRDGSSIKDLTEIFASYNFKTNLYEVIGGISKISKKAIPCIAYHKSGHYVVVEKEEKFSVIILDPAIGRMRISKKELEENYRNMIIRIVPEEDFKKLNTRNKEFRIIKEAILENKGLVISCAGIAVIVYSLMMVVPIILKQIVDRYLMLNYVDNQMIKLACIVGISSFIFYLVNIIKLFMEIKLSIRADKYLSFRVIDKLFKSKFEFFLNRTSSEIQYRLVLLKNLKIVISDVLIQVLLDIGSMIVIMIYVMHYHLIYACVLTSITLFVLGLSVLIKNKMLLYKNEELSRDSNLQILQQDIFRSIFDVKILGLCKLKKDLWREDYEAYIKIHEKSQKFSATYKNILSYVSMYIPIIITLIGILMSDVVGNNQIGTIISLQSLTGVYISALISVSQLVDSITTVKSLLLRIEDILVQKEEVDGNLPASLEGNIEVKNLSFKYPGAKKEVLSNLSFSIKAGESVAIVGESGSGKSTLFYTLLGAYDEYEGRIEYEGIELKDIKKDEFRNQIAAVPQNALLFNGSIKDNITQHLKISDEEIYDVLRKVSLYEFVQNLPMNINTLISENAFNLSGGQKQRIALARAIIKRKPILFLDEATSSLDNITEQKIVEQLNDISQTKIVIAHRLSTIKNSDKIIVMKKGRIAEVGNHYQLMALRGEYYRMYYKNIGDEYRYGKAN